MFLKSNRGICRMERHNQVFAVARIVSPTARSSPLLTPLISLHYLWMNLHRPLYKSSMRLDITLTPISLSNQGTHDGPASGLPSHNVIVYDYFVARTRKESMQGNSSEDFSGWSGSVKEEPPTPSARSGIMGRLKNFGKLVCERCCKYFNSRVNYCC